MAYYGGLIPLVIAGGQRRATTPFGSLHVQGDDLRITANPEQLHEWATRWPCSTLRRAGRVTVIVDSTGDLVGLIPNDADILGDELTAWMSDVITEAAQNMGVNA